MGAFPRSADIAKLLLGLHQCAPGRLRLICGNRDRWLESWCLCAVRLALCAYGLVFTSESHCAALGTPSRWPLNTEPAAPVCLLLLLSRSLSSASRALRLHRLELIAAASHQTPRRVCVMVPKRLLSPTVPSQLRPFVSPRWGRAAPLWLSAILVQLDLADGARYLTPQKCFVTEKMETV